MGAQARVPARKGFAHRRVLVVGLGRSGRAAAEALLAAGASVTAVDAGADGRLAAVAGSLERAGARVALDVPLDDPGSLTVLGPPRTAAGGGDPDVVIASPGVPPATAVLRAAAQRGIPVLSEPELGWRLNGGATRVVGITGTNGKTTTTELVAAGLRAPAAGNIGTPLVTLLAAEPPPPLVVAELSSFQLHHTSSLRTDVGVLLNVAEDHLDWHGDVRAYGADKARIYAGHRGAGGAGLDGRDWAVVGVDDPGARDVVAAHPPAGGILGFTVAEPRPGEVGVADGRITAHLPGRDAVGVVDVAALALRGPHNVANVAAAVAAALAAGAEPATLAAPLAARTPGAHRLAVVAERGGVRFVDDSKATNPHAAAAAIATFPSVVWIAGGLAKGVDMGALDPLLRERVRAVVTIGTDGPAIAARSRGLGIPTVEAGDLASAVPAAADLARAGDTVLLAPACASMDQFTDYAERGRAFAALVAHLGGGTGRGGVEAPGGEDRPDGGGDPSSQRHREALADGTP